MANDDLNDLKEVDFGASSKDELESLLQDTHKEDNSLETFQDDKLDDISIDDVQYQGSQTSSTPSINNDLNLSNYTSDEEVKYETPTNPTNQSVPLSTNNDNQNTINTTKNTINQSTMGNTVSSTSANVIEGLTQKEPNQLPRLDDILLPKGSK